MVVLDLGNGVSVDTIELVSEQKLVGGRNGEAVIRVIGEGNGHFFATAETKNSGGAWTFCSSDSASEIKSAVKAVTTVLSMMGYEADN